MVESDKEERKRNYFEDIGSLKMGYEKLKGEIRELRAWVEQLQAGGTILKGGWVMDRQSIIERVARETYSVINKPITKSEAWDYIQDDIKYLIRDQIGRMLEAAGFWELLDASEQYLNVEHIEDRKDAKLCLGRFIMAIANAGEAG